MGQRCVGSLHDIRYPGKRCRRKSSRHPLLGDERPAVDPVIGGVERATRTGLEPATSGSTVRGSNQLSYRAMDLSFKPWAFICNGIRRATGVDALRKTTCRLPPHGRVRSISTETCLARPTLQLLFRIVESRRPVGRVDTDRPFLPVAMRVAPNTERVAPVGCPVLRLWGRLLGLRDLFLWLRRGVRFRGVVRSRGTRWPNWCGTFREFDIS